MTGLSFSIFERFTLSPNVQYFLKLVGKYNFTNGRKSCDLSKAAWQTIALIGGREFKPRSSASYLQR